jgi:hypothetical protein
VELPEAAADLAGQLFRGLVFVVIDFEFQEQAGAHHAPNDTIGV